VRAFIDTIDNKRAVGTAAIAALLHERFGLPAGLTVAHAPDILWTLTAPELPIRLVHRRGWSLDKCEVWSADNGPRAALHQPTRVNAPLSPNPNGVRKDRFLPALFVSTIDDLSWVRWPSHPKPPRLPL